MNSFEKHRKENTSYSFIKNSALIILSVVVAVLISELLVSTLFSGFKQKGGYAYVDHPDLGWTNKPGHVSVVETSEFISHYRINSSGFNDDKVNLTALERILVLGDSHTFGLGVNTEQVWPSVLEEKLNDNNSEYYSVINTGVNGYSLGQYLVTLRKNVKSIKPTVVLIGFSMATDLYDLVPPGRGGFIYGPDKKRIYHDIESGKLVEITPDGEQQEKNKSNQVEEIATNEEKSWQITKLILKIIRQSSLYQLVKRTPIAVWFAAHYKPRGISLWPGLDTALEVDLNEENSYRWLLAEKIIGKIKQESGSATVYLVNIPYLAQVYDSIWNNSFGSNPDQYDRFIASSRLKHITARLDIGFIDMTIPFVETHRTIGGWLHFKLDGHPNEVGHNLIANTVSDVLLK